jgi:hypothetical protein
MVGPFFLLLSMFYWPPNRSLQDERVFLEQYRGGLRFVECALRGSVDYAGR